MLKKNLKVSHSIIIQLPLNNSSNRSSKYNYLLPVINGEIGHLLSTVFLMVFSVLVTKLKAQSDALATAYEIQYGSLPNIESGAKTTIGLHPFLFDHINHCVEESKFNSIAGRAANFALVQFYLGAHTFGTFPHEYFGHRSRAKEFGINGDLQLAFPAFGGNFDFRVSHATPAIERTLISAAGPESTGMIAYEAIKRIYSGNSVPHYLGNFLLGGKIIDGYIYIQNDFQSFIDDPNQYMIDNAEYFEENAVPNDPTAYALALTESYGFYDSFITESATWIYRPEDMEVYLNAFIRDQYYRMEKAYLLTLLDPVDLYFLIFNCNYIIKGERNGSPFMFSIDQVQFMPSIRANLEELGAENYYDLFFKIPRFPAFNIYYRNGGNQIYQVNGGGVEIRQLTSSSNRWSFEFQADSWSDERRSKGLFNAMQTARWYPRDRSGFLASIGFKSEGGLMGKPYKSGVYGSAGLVYRSP